MQEITHLRERGEYIQALRFKISRTSRKWRKGNNHLPVVYEKGSVERNASYERRNLNRFKQEGEKLNLDWPYAQDGRGGEIGLPWNVHRGNFLPMNRSFKGLSWRSSG